VRLGSIFVAGAAAALSLGATACATETTLESGLSVPTGVLVNPSDFLGDVACSTRPGGMQSYVATLIDVGDPLNPFTLPSSPATACSLGTDFRYVVEGHPYLAEVDGYTEPALDLVPLGGAASGSRHMLAINTEVQVSPRWTGACGLGSAPAVASFDDDVPVANCEPLTDHAGASTTGIEVDPTGTMPTAGSCTADAGDVASFDVLPRGSALAPMNGVVCEDTEGAPSHTVIYDVGVAAGTDYTFQILARGADGGVVGVAECFATAQANLVVLASCDPLSP
jgi:hypothetical protein